MIAILVIAAFGIGLLLGVMVSRRQPAATPAPPAPAPRPAPARPVDVEPELDELDLVGDEVVTPTAVTPDASDDGLTDPQTGLLNAKVLAITLDARISAARRHLRPVAVVVLEVVEGVHDERPRPADQVRVAAAIEKTLREADTACRLDRNRFGLVLEDTPETGAVWTVERLRRNLAPENPGYTMWAGVACYPAHAFSAEEILDRADAALTAAKEWRQDRIEVATAAE